MRLIDYLNTLNWTQTRLAEEARISVSTVGRVIQEKTVSRKNADDICAALSRGMGRTIHLTDVNEIHVTRAERPERRKVKRE